MSLKTKIKQYGIKNSIKRGVKLLYRRIGVQYESYYLLENNVDIEELHFKMQQYDFSDIQELSFDDFMKADPAVFTAAKIEIIRSRFNIGNYRAYGIKNQHNLIYSFWVTDQYMTYPVEKKPIPLQSNVGFLEDAYCDHLFRGKGLHTKMTLYLVNLLYENRKNKILTVILCENTPAIKSQLKCGFKITKKTVFLKMWGLSRRFEKIIN